MLSECLIKGKVQFNLFFFIALAIGSIAYENTVLVKITDDGNAKTLL